MRDIRYVVRLFLKAEEGQYAFEKGKLLRVSEEARFLLCIKTKENDIIRKTIVN